MVANSMSPVRPHNNNQDLDVILVNESGKRLTKLNEIITGREHFEEVQPKVSQSFAGGGKASYASRP